jgi:hypothetical protein
MTGPAENDEPASIPPTAQPVVGDSMNIDVKFASNDSVGVPLTATKFQVPTPALTV